MKRVLTLHGTGRKPTGGYGSVLKPTEKRTLLGVSKSNEMAFR